MSDRGMSATTLGTTKAANEARRPSFISLRRMIFLVTEGERCVLRLSE